MKSVHRLSGKRGWGVAQVECLPLLMRPWVQTARARDEILPHPSRLKQVLAGVGDVGLSLLVGAQTIPASVEVGQKVLKKLLLGLPHQLGLM